MNWKHEKLLNRPSSKGFMETVGSVSIVDDEVFSVSSSILLELTIHDDVSDHVIEESLDIVECEQLLFVDAAVFESA